MSIRKKVELSDECQLGNHHFIVSDWKCSPARQQAVTFTCRRCLYASDGIQTNKQLVRELHAVSNVEAASDSVVGKDIGSKSNKDSSGGA